MEKWNLYSALLVVTLVCVHAQACPDGCTCKPQQSFMSCRGLNSLPDTFDSGTTVFVFDNCNFHGELGKIPAAYNGAHQLQIIHSHVESIGLNAFEDLKDLKMLGLRGNKLDYIDASALMGLEELKTIDLQGNRITEIEDELFKSNPELDRVVLNDNPIKNLAKRAFAQPKDPNKDPDKMSKIRHIAMENCSLTEFPGPVFCMHSKLPHLESLDLSRNNLSNLAEFQFKHVDGLFDLELDSCHLSSIGRETFGKMTKLRRLRLSNNKISAIDLHAFDDFFSTMEEIHLDYNNLKEAPYGLFNFATIQILNISYNPWECSCANGWMQEFGIQSNDTKYNITCASPDEYKGKNALQVMKEVMEPCDPPHSGPDPMVAVYVAIPIIIILSVVTIIIIVKICILKKKESSRRSAQYSLVYKPTTEKA